MKAASALVEGAVIETRYPLVEDLLDFALALGFELTRLLDPSRGFLVIDVDQEDPRPGVDGGLIVAAVAGGLTALEQFLDAHRVLA